MTSFFLHSLYQSIHMNQYVYTEIQEEYNNILLKTFVVILTNLISNQILNNIITISINNNNKSYSFYQVHIKKDLVLHKVSNSINDNIKSFSFYQVHIKKYLVHYKNCQTLICLTS